MDCSSITHGGHGTVSGSDIQYTLSVCNLFPSLWPRQPIYGVTATFGPPGYTIKSSVLATGIEQIKRLELNVIFHSLRVPCKII